MKGVNDIFTKHDSENLFFPKNRLFILNSSLHNRIDKSLNESNDTEIYIALGNKELNMKEIAKIIREHNETDNYIFCENCSQIKELIKLKCLFQRGFVTNNIGLSNNKICKIESTLSRNNFIIEKSRHELKEWEGNVDGIEDCVIIGMGITGITLAKELSKSARSILMLERESNIGGIWNSHANPRSTAYSCDPVYMVRNKRNRNKPNVSKEEISNDLYFMANNLPKHVKFMMNSNVDSVYNDGKGEVVSFNRKGVSHVVKANRVFFCTNNNFGELKNIDFRNELLYEGQIYNGLGNEIRDTTWKDKTVLVIGDDPTVVDVVRIALESDAKSIVVLSKKYIPVQPEMIEYLNNIRPRDINLNYSNTGTKTILDIWKLLCEKCNINSSPDSLSTIAPVSDLWFIGHYHGIITSIIGEISDVHSTFVITKLGTKIDCDVIVKCGGFTESKSKKIPNVSKIYENGLIRNNVIALNAFSEIISADYSYTETLKILCMYYQKFLSQDEPIKTGGNLINISDYKKSHLMNYIKNNTDIDLTSFVLEKIINFYDRYTPPTFIELNQGKWDRLNVILAKKSNITKELKYPFESILSYIYAEWFNDELVVGNLESLKTDDTIYTTNLKWCSRYKKRVINNSQIKIRSLDNSIIDELNIQNNSDIDTSGGILYNFYLFKKLIEGQIPQDFKNTIDNHNNFDIQKNTINFLSGTFWRINSIGKRFFRNLTCLELKKFDLEYGTLLNTLYMQISFPLSNDILACDVIKSVKQTICYHSILKTVIEHISMTYSTYSCDCDYNHLPTIKLNFNNVAMFDFHIYTNKVILNSNFDHTFFDISTIHLILKTIDDYLYNSGNNLPTCLKIMYNPIKYDCKYFTNFTNSWTNQIANQVIASISNGLSTKSYLEISSHIIEQIKMSLSIKGYNLTDYQIVSFIYTILVFEIFQHRMKEDDSFCVLNSKFVRSYFGSNSLGNFVVWEGPDVLNASVISSMNISELLNWWSNGISDFSKDDSQEQIKDGTIRVIFDDWTCLNEIQSEIHYESITTFPFGDTHTDCSTANKINLHIIKKGHHYCLNKPIQCSGIDIKTCWEQAKSAIF